VLDSSEARPVPAANLVYDFVKQAIFDRSYPGGTIVTEGEIASAVGVSRTPVREALLRVEAEGLLRLYPKKGALILPVSAQEIEDVIEVRELVERHAAGKAWQRRAELLPLLEAHLADMRRELEAGDVAALMAADRDFHAAMIAATGNAILVKLYASLRDRQLCMGVAAMRISPERRDRAVAEHTAFVEAMRDGDEDRFRRLIHDHVQGTAESLRSGL